MPRIRKANNNKGRMSRARINRVKHKEKMAMKKEADKVQDKAKDDTKPPLRPITLIKDTTLKIPELWLEVWVVGDASEQAAFAELFVRACCRKAKSPLEADLVIFSGGSDVNPKLYGEVQHPKTYFNDRRDQEDIAVYRDCLDHGVPMLGICRGAQFLHVMNGGKLYQDVDGHYGDHSMFDIFNKRTIPKISSVHHQMVIENKKMEVLAISVGQSKKRAATPSKIEEGDSNDIEAFWYKDTCCIGIQGHPEYRGYYQYAQWTFDLLEELVVHNNDLVWGDNIRRINAKTQPIKRVQEKKDKA